LPSDEKVLYLSFDDGPIPEVTPDVLDVLKKYQVKATFFCVGENLEKNKDIIARIEKEGHEVGNHTYNHLKGWRTKDEDYFTNIDKFESLYPTKLFRPPYGKMKWSQIKRISKQYKIILWSVLTYDFDPKLSIQSCLDIAMKSS